MYVYINAAPDLHIVGHYNPTGAFVHESSHKLSIDAAARVHYLNGGSAHRTLSVDATCYKP